MSNEVRFKKDISRELEVQLKKCEDIYMVARLRDDSATYASNTGAISIYMDALCNEPKPLIELNNYLAKKGREQASNNYIAFDYVQEYDVLPQFYEKNEYNPVYKQEELLDYYNDKLIIFNPSYTFNFKNDKWFKNMIITKVIDVSTNPELLETHYAMIPRYLGSPRDFEKVLENGEYFDLFEYDNNVCPEPEYIMCGSYVYRTNENSFIQSDTNAERWRCDDFSCIDKIDYTKFEDYKTRIFRASDSIVFVEANLNSDIRLATEVLNMGEEEPIKVAINSITEPIIEEIDDEIETNDNDNDNGEAKFVDGLYKLTLDNGLQYEFKDLVNFHTSIKTTPLVILSGMSGTGKSRLAINYAKMLNLSEDNGTLLFMPISPSYTEPSDVVGYLNSMNDTYIPSETGLVQFLIHAKNNPDKMHMVIFDEMNLSQVEYWFSPFISLLEKDPEEQILRLYDEDARCENSEYYPPKVKIGENILFVGTVNVDDTTKNFSDRLLDRTFVINLNKVKFVDFYDEYNKNKAAERSDYSNAKCKDVSQYKSWTRSKGQKYMEAFKNKENELSFFDEFDLLIRKYIPNGGISHRVMRNIGNYILNVPNLESDDIDRKDIFDTVVNQTILTKIRGTETQLQSLIGEINDENNKLVNSELASLLDKYSDISEFKAVRLSLLSKAEELRINGFTN